MSPPRGECRVSGGDLTAGNVRFAEHESEGVILKRGAEYLVKPVTPAQAARAGAHFQRGDLVSLDPRGRFVQAPDRGLSRGGEMDQGLDR
jgi:hypothetical protein